MLFWTIAICGTVSTDGRLEVQATSVGAHTQLAQKVALTEQAQTRKADVQKLRHTDHRYPDMQDSEVFGVSAQAMWIPAASAECGSEHAIARAIEKAASPYAGNLLPLAEFTAKPGLGAVAALSAQDSRSCCSRVIPPARPRTSRRRWASIACMSACFRPRRPTCSAPYRKMASVAAIPIPIAAAGLLNPLIAAAGDVAVIDVRGLQQPAHPESARLTLIATGAAAETETSLSAYRRSYSSRATSTSAM